MSTSHQTTRGYGFPQPPPAPAPVPHPAPVPGRGSRLLRRSFWGFAGAVLASVVWTAALWTVPSMVSTASSPLPVGSYRTTDDLCSAATFSRFGQLYPVASGTAYHYTTRNRALDDMYCSQYLKRSANDSGYITLSMEVQLHRAVSAAPEFEAQRSGFDQRRFQVSDVPELGDEAFVGYLDDQSGADRTRHYLTQTLYVRDGALTCYLNWSGSYQEGKESAPDRDGIRQALVIDTRDALRALGER
ncbi:hypothetical protein P3T37_001028 [Kitasatospora sp. MAA4]|uniref:hypothetical protein n=1 Tax=Kitasatospora sp. MAA4 TaxID=3035093 RepID=UPI0024762A77|nr:hypothetical protein [Kitasatospora sp. MAA4]MDH6131654.1 hypothetical protein [Kitasatospora sp. MAA4]